MIVRGSFRGRGLVDVPCTLACMKITLDENIPVRLAGALVTSEGLYSFARCFVVLTDWKLHIGRFLIKAI